MKTVAAFMLLVIGLTVCATAAASDYTFANGYYWASGVPYTRAQYYGYYNGCCRYYYTYTPVANYTPPVPAYTPPAVPAYAPFDWKTPGIEFLKNRDNWILKERAAALDYQQFKDFLDFAGVKGNFAVQGYGQNISYGSPTYSQYAAVQGSTIYGHAQHDYIAATGQAAFGQVDLNQANQAFARSTEAAIGFGKEAHGNQGAIIAQYIDGLAKIEESKSRREETQARAAAAIALWKAVEENKIVIERKGTDFKIVPPGVPGVPAPQPVPNPGEENLDKLGAVMQAKCAACHSGAKIEGKLDLTQWRSFDRAKKMSIWARVVEQDPDKRMPRKVGGGPGEPLTPEEAALFLPTEPKLR